MKVFLLCLGLLFVFSSFIMAQQISREKEAINNSLGIGFGIPYGIIGANIDINLLPHANMSFGLGTTYVAGASYNFGLKLFLADALQVFRPRISVYYGINSVKSFKQVYNNDSYTGLSLATGCQFLWHNTKWGFDFDVIYIANSTIERIDPNSRVKISIGLRRGF